ncbi:unnamed protein product [Staurois parvus]|uniref:Uncharacterized protein n=1 Tax=Staurois parvus TaxID=386267 RepID=A0ABN9AQ86_9NEOB|nr:unnamed protein product [Staurois parvus]
MCHFQVSSHCWCVPFCHRVLADYGPPIAAARPRNLPWAPVPPPHAAARSRVSHGSLYGLPLLLSPSPHSGHVPLFRSPHTAGGFHFCHRVAVWPPIAAASTATLWLHHSGFGPVNCPNE